ncbi:MAG: UDP-3-O-(3-hydroxymyristoyl)glucosamine N-acyltransferase [Acidobacteriota bacterium]|nr:UDP-3-O-(3-hydroxymyristoyl)glucosamine N-acyltransferase [Acidobacteriota bacterium]
MKLSEIARRTGCELEGPADLEISGVAAMEDATSTELTFLSNPKYIRKAASTAAAAIIASPDAKIPDRAVLRARDPYLAFAYALEIFHPPARPPAGVHPSAVIAPTAKIGPNASIGPYVVIEDGAEVGESCVLKSFVMIYSGARIGDRFFAHAHAVVRENVRIGNDVVLQNGVVVGGDGFGFAKTAAGSYYKLAEPGTVVIEDAVEIQSNSCVDRATVGITRLRRGVKVDNLVQVGHGCDIGEDSLLCGQAGLAGSSHIGRNCILAGQAGVAGHLTIGDNSIVSSQAGVPRDVPAGSVISGSPAIDNFQWLKCTAAYARLPEMASALRKIRDYLNKNGANV